MKTSAMFKVASVVMCAAVVASTWILKPSARCAENAADEIEKTDSALQDEAKPDKMEETILDIPVLIATSSDEGVDNDAPAEEQKPTEEENPDIEIDYEEAAILAQVAWGEYKGPNDEEVLAVYWCIFNRVDANIHGGNEGVKSVATFPNQFIGYRSTNPIDERLLGLACYALKEWQTEKVTMRPSESRVLPAEFLWFSGNKEQTNNVFRDTYEFTYETRYIRW